MTQLLHEILESTESLIDVMGAGGEKALGWLLGTALAVSILSSFMAMSLMFMKLLL